VVRISQALLYWFNDNGLINEKYQWINRINAGLYWKNLNLKYTKSMSLEGLNSLGCVRNSEISQRIVKNVSYSTKTTYIKWFQNQFLLSQIYFIVIVWKTRIARFTIKFHSIVRFSRAGWMALVFLFLAICSLGHDS
jgi:hypothetical protein